jgi:hypothetical protein
MLHLVALVLLKIKATGFTVFLLLALCIWHPQKLDVVPSLLAEQKPP